ncbi:hypothetical protein CHS0354_020585 [Potamilus streckersoni]|uniref:Uncharacterized protein n=1 Tax=Potamilus streckersoni TaxID=2493646 RepID=A0AAE0RR83_9BIVA|nr:hypothetical protein CHS0354_020585 [Potamilus streckersoni]
MFDPKDEEAVSGLQSIHIMRHICLYLAICIELGYKFPVVGAASLSQTQNLYDHLFQNYNQKLLPLLNQSHLLQVNVSLNLVSITDFNEISGELVLIGYFSLAWTDEQLSWDTEQYGGKASLVVPPEDVWRPKLSLIYPFQSTQWLGNGSAQIRIFPDGTVVWFFGEVISALCSYDTTFYPFDSQSCKLELTALGWNSIEIELDSPDSQVLLNYYKENGEWSLTRSIVESYSIKDISVIGFTLKLKRKPQFPLIYIIIPVVLLGGLDYWIVLIPDDSGERVSCAMTVFLSFSVYMGIISDNMPKSSDPISYLYYYLLLLMLLSGSIVVLLVLSSKLHRKDGSCLVPLYIKYLVWILRLRFLRSRKTKVSTIAHPNIVQQLSYDGTVPEKFKAERNSVNDGTDKNDSSSDSFYAECSWVLVAHTYDLSCFVTFAISHTLITAIYLGILYQNITLA